MTLKAFATISRYSVCRNHCHISSAMTSTNTSVAPSTGVTASDTNASLDELIANDNVSDYLSVLLSRLERHLLTMTVYGS